MTVTRIVIRFQLEGLHSWPEAGNIFPDVSFLSNTHRHMFHFEVKKQVDHDDRDIELIRFKREVQKYIADQYGTPCNFEHRSCEMIAKELKTKFSAAAVSVFEDGENGAEVIETKY